MRVWLAHPAFRRSCRACAAYQYAPDGTLDRDPATGDPLRRPEHAPTPCLSCPKVPAWAKSSGRDWDACRDLADELTPANRAALAAYFRHKATGRFPDDAIASWAAGIIREAEDELARDEVTRSYEATVTLLTVLARRVR